MTSSFPARTLLFLHEMIWPWIPGIEWKKGALASFHWGRSTFVVYKNMDDTMKKHPEADVLVSFASLRSAYESTVEAMQYPQVWGITVVEESLPPPPPESNATRLKFNSSSHQIRTIAIIAEGIPENLTRKLVKMATEKGISIIGPATVSCIMCLSSIKCIDIASLSSLSTGATSKSIVLRLVESNQAASRLATPEACWTTSWHPSSTGQAA